MKTIKNIKKNKEKEINLKFSSFDEVFKKSFKNKQFKSVYNEEIARMNISKQIKEIRNQNNLTQKMLAIKANMPQSVIARIENGNHSISLGTLSRIANVFNKEVILA